MPIQTVVLLVLLLFVVQLFLQETSAWKFNLWQIMGNRDTPPKPGRIARRLERAKNNMLEALPLFLGLALLNLVRTPDAPQAIIGANLFLAARVLYVPIYAASIPVLRSLIWLVGMGGLLMMALALV